MKTKTFRIYIDSGHGWLRVPVVLVDELGLRDSFKDQHARGSWVYLEEDAAAPLFVKTLLEKKNIQAKFYDPYSASNNWSDTSRIRSYRYLIDFPIQKVVQNTAQDENI